MWVGSAKNEINDLSVRIPRNGKLLTFVATFNIIKKKQRKIIETHIGKFTKNDEWDRFKV